MRDIISIADMFIDQILISPYPEEPIKNLEKLARIIEHSIDKSNYFVK